MTDVEMNGRGGDSSWAARSVEGWIIIVTNLNEECTEEDLQDFFGEYGEVKNLTMPLNRRTGYVMGYALVEYHLREEAEKAVKATTGTTFLEQTITTDFAFSKGNPGGGAGGGRGGGGRGGPAAGGPRRTGGRDRSLSPGRR